MSVSLSRIFLWAALALVSVVSTVRAQTGPTPAAASSGKSPNAEKQVARLDEAVTLSAEQKTAALEIFRRQNDALDALPSAERNDKALPIRMAARDQVKALLTPEQQNKYFRIPQSRGGGQLQNPDLLFNRFDETVGLTAEQKPKAQEIFLNYIATLSAYTNAERAQKALELRMQVDQDLRRMLTPDQQRKFDATPQKRGGGAL